MKHAIGYYSYTNRSSRGVEKIHLPEKLKTIPELFKEAGYYTCNSQEHYDKKGKEDYNFDYVPSQLYDGTDWRERAAGQPFFAQIHNLAGNQSYASNLNALRTLLNKWIQETGDQGMTPETVKNYDSNMEAYLTPFRKRGKMERAKNIEANMALMKQWAKEGK